MNTLLRWTRCASCCATLAMLAGCGESHFGFNPSATMDAVAGPSNVHALGASYKALVAFDGTNGSRPNGLIALNGILYGTTVDGGAYRRGIAFRVTAAGVETVLHSFQGRSDGAHPAAGLTNVGGTLYGTTSNGGSGCYASGCGTVFNITASGKESVLYRFKGGSGDGEGPAGLINFKGTLYGTTGAGGTHGYGTVFKITPSGEETVLYSFGGSAGGEDPATGLINFKGTLYGTTGAGGTHGYGTVFKITPSGEETVLYSFRGGSDGEGPNGLAVLDGTLYGTTFQGGSYSCRGNGCGTVFEISTSGNERVLYRFNNYYHGAFPEASLTAFKGALYGTASEAGYKVNLGTIYSISGDGKDQLVYSFLGGKNGASPRVSLTVLNQTLYGTTYEGGGTRCEGGCGTVFALTL